MFNVPMPEFDPLRSVSFSYSCRSTDPNHFAMECSEAVFGDITQSATTCRWRLHLDCSHSSELNGRYSATKSAVEISVPGHNQPVICFPKLPFNGPLHSKSCRIPYASNSALAAGGAASTQWPFLVGCRHQGDI